MLKSRTAPVKKISKTNLILSFVILFTLGFASCKKDQKSNLNPDTKEVSKKDAIQVCTAPEPLSRTGSKEPKTSAALYSSKKWATGQTIKIKFLNGDTYLQEKVKQYASTWLNHASLQFQYVGGTETADIKIGFKFNGDSGSWSYMGTDCHYIDQAAPSMNFGWFTSSTSESEFSRVIVHEFGHALGLIHEHLSPSVTINWNKQAVYDYYAGAPNYWTQAQVDNNLFNKFSASETQYTTFDTQSIMLYSFPASFTTDGFSAPWNTVLSETDKSFIKTIYPGTTSPAPAETLTLNPTSFNFNRSSRNSSFTIASNASWTVSTPGWISVGSNTKGQGDLSVPFSVSYNSSGRTRTGTITVTTSGGSVKTLSVTQSR
jgi:hypothetical protein